MSDQSNEAWRQQDWDAYEEDNTKVASLPLEEWIHAYDAEAFTQSKFLELADEIRKDPTPAHHVHVAEPEVAAA